MSPRNLPPWLLQTTGLALLIFFTAFWAATGRVEPVLLASAGGLIGIGEYARGGRALSGPDEPTPPPVAPAEQPNGGGP